MTNDLERRIARGSVTRGLKRRREYGAVPLFVPVSVWILLFILVPFFIMLMYSLWVSRDAVIVKQVTLDNYLKFFRAVVYPTVLFRTLLLASGVTVLTFVLGYPLALYIYRRRGRAKAILYMLVIIPLVTSYIVRIYSMRLVLGSNGVLNSLLLILGVIREPLQIFLFNRFAIFLTLCVTLSPFMVMPVYTALEKVPRSFIEASRDLGASELETFWRVIFPLSLPGVVAGVMFIFILSMSDFLTPILVGGSQGLTIGKVIQTNFGIAFDWPFGAALSFILLIITLLIVLISSRFGAMREI